MTPRHHGGAACPQFTRSCGVTLIALDPLGGSMSGQVAFLGGMVHVGPRAAGDGLGRFTTGGQLSQLLTLSVSKDPSGMRNTQSGPFSTVGGPGCVPNSSCGPDNEDASPLMFAGNLAGTELVAFGSARSSGGVNYA